MIITQYHINHVMKSYFKQTRSINQGSREAQQLVSDSVKLSTAGKKRLFERMKENAIDQIKIQYKGR